MSRLEPISIPFSGEMMLRFVRNQYGKFEAVYIQRKRTYTT